MTFSVLPDELILLIFSEFHLTSLISASGVCHKWRNLLLVADIHPARLALLQLYKQLIEEPWFLPSRPWVLNNLTSFNRAAYVTALLEQHDFLPEDFQIWVLEWPAKAAFGGIWPGLPNEIGDIAGPEIRYSRRTWNFLNPLKPIVWTINHINEDNVDFDADIDQDYFIEPLPGLAISLTEGNDTTWLLFDKGRYRDRAIRTCASENEFADDLEVVVWSSWVDCLRCTLRDVLYEYASATDTRILRSPSPRCDSSRTISSTPWVDSSHTPFTHRA
ncbi:hypothetical protein ONZ45_g6912 [Pleurotus djamor]|nr:hypothetical protein ONZ45_g6912 [Pleurotus djamor]